MKGSIPQTSDSDPSSVLAYVWLYLSKGFSVIPVIKGTKKLRGEMQLQVGQVITLVHDQALTLLNEGKMIPTEKVAYRVYWKILQVFLWVVETDEDMKSLRDRSITEPIYTADEIRKLKGIDREDLKKIHRVKQVFENSKVEDSKPKKDREVL